MKVHLSMPIFWTACNMSARDQDSMPTKLLRSANKSLVTCGSCKRTQAFFSRDDVPTAEVTEHKTAKGLRV
jgi:hypothetical protein